MKVTHTDIEEYFRDLERAKSKGETPVVRTDVETLEINPGVVQVYVVSGYYDNEALYELTVECGEMLAGEKVSEASESAKQAIESVARKCQQLGFDHGGGKWQL